MAKSQNSKKQTKKAPAKTPAQKKAVKAAKKTKAYRVSFFRPFNRSFINGTAIRCAVFFVWLNRSWRIGAMDLHPFFRDRRETRW